LYHKGFSNVLSSCTFLRNLDIDINLPHLLDVGHLPEAGHHVQRGGELQARQLTRELAVDVPLQHPDESVLSLRHSPLVN